MAEFLVKAASHVHQDAQKDRIGAYKKGNIVRVEEDGFIWGLEETLPKFVLVKVPGLAKADSVDKSRSWDQFAELDIVAHNEVLDGYRLRLYGTVPGAANQAGITKEKAEAFIIDWGGMISSFGQNEVVFDAGIYNAIKTNVFWGRDVSGLVFDELSYASGSGIHRISVDYSSTSYSGSTLVGQVTRRGGENIVDSEIAVDFDIASQVIRSAFKIDLQEKLFKRYKRRRYGFLSTDVDTALAAGGEIELTEVQFNNKLQDSAG